MRGNIPRAERDAAGLAVLASWKRVVCFSIPAGKLGRKLAVASLCPDGERFCFPEACLCYEGIIVGK